MKHFTPTLLHPKARSRDGEDADRSRRGLFGGRWGRLGRRVAGLLWVCRVELSALYRKNDIKYMEKQSATVIARLELWFGRIWYDWGIG